jgi:myb proto-oncogene protein
MDIEQIARAKVKTAEDAAPAAIVAVTEAEVAAAAAEQAAWDAEAAEAEAEVLEAAMAAIRPPKKCESS